MDSGLVSPEYLAQLRQMHADNPNWGRGPARTCKDVFDFIERYDIRTLLDYGCGKAMLSLLLQQFCRVSNYDPGLPQYAAPPEPHDYTVCIDVLEHVEPTRLPQVLDHIASVTNKVALLHIATIPAFEQLPDGRNAHLVVLEYWQWFERLLPHFEILKFWRGTGSANFYVEPR